MPTLICSGGGARDALWRAIQASVYGRRLSTVGESEHSAYGAALLAATGVGLISTPQQARLAIVEEIEPDPAEVSRYDEVFNTYRRLYPALQPIFSAPH